MKGRLFIIFILLTIVLEISGCFYFLEKMERVQQDTVVVNECLYSVEKNWKQENQYDNQLTYAVIDNEGTVLYQNQDGISNSINQAIRNNDLILDVVVDDACVGKMIFHNETTDKIDTYRNQMQQIILVIAIIQLLFVLGYFFYLRKQIVSPFKKLNDFAIRVAGGNLDLPLDMDRKHIFGSFTEAFDLMRSELKKARIAEKKANDDKKEMVAKLSHDIKTPVASIKATSEFGYELAKDEKSKEMFNQINVKSDQITTLVDNLFNSSIQDITEIAVSPSNYNSDILYGLMDNADYLHKANKVEVPKCNIFCDKLRLQQAFDNIFMNSYKYANTEIAVKAYEKAEYLVVKIADCGNGVKDEELPLLKEKYRRGSNISEKDGAGLGLYLTNYFLQNMDGKIELKNENPGFAVYLYIRRI